jgi:hypothetical protein
LFVVLGLSVKQILAELHEYVSAGKAGFVIGQMYYVQQRSAIPNLSLDK